MGTRRQPASSSDEAQRLPGPAVRDYALEFAVATLLGALPGTRRLDQWWVRQSWRRILLYRLVTAAVAVALDEQPRKHLRDGIVSARRKSNDQLRAAHLRRCRLIETERELTTDQLPCDNTAVVHDRGIQDEAVGVHAQFHVLIVELECSLDLKRPTGTVRTVRERGEVIVMLFVSPDCKDHRVERDRHRCIKARPRRRRCTSTPPTRRSDREAAPSSRRIPSSGSAAFRSCLAAAVSKRGETLEFLDGDGVGVDQTDVWMPREVRRRVLQKGERVGGE